jgi:hypothetical protein
MTFLSLQEPAKQSAPESLNMRWEEEVYLLGFEGSRAVPSLKQPG